MPKLKTHSGTKDLVKVSKNVKLRAGSPNKNHFLRKKSGSRTRALSGLKTRTGTVAKTLRKQLGL